MSDIEKTALPRFSPFCSRMRYNCNRRHQQKPSTEIGAVKIPPGFKFRFRGGRISTAKSVLVQMDLESSTKIGIQPSHVAIHHISGVHFCLVIVPKYTTGKKRRYWRTEASCGKYRAGIHESVVGLYLQLPKKEIRLFFEPVTIRGRYLTEREKDRADEKRPYSGRIQPLLVEHRRRRGKTLPGYRKEGFSGNRAHECQRKEVMTTCEKKRPALPQLIPSYISLPLLYLRPCPPNLATSLAPRLTNNEKTFSHIY
ncbi:hypothetical protein DFH08DRAFT_825054 [Mycena albidolilacea]|uniref:Uncharacterized protein n=1 Tax=Mycena albidolilacea TaxID=1033008 RepID=A0AAD6Z2V8_9AGAR|nr:hypothetical protein DFH08DRAFT_825054 [Mycena albidolilacea]